MTEEPITVSIRDLGIAAALATCDFEMTGTKRDVKGRTHFVFVETAALDEAVKMYYADMLQVNARRFFDNTRMLKGLIYSNKYK